MSLSESFDALLNAAADNYQGQFLGLPYPDVQIAIYQKLLFKSGEGDVKASAALASLKDPVFQNALPAAVRDGLSNEQQRYNVAKANAVYQDFLYQATLRGAVAAQDGSLMYDPQGRLVHELKLDAAAKAQALQTIEASLGLVGEAARTPEVVNTTLKRLLGGRTPTDTILCSIDLTGAAPAVGGDDYRALQGKYQDKYGAVNIPSHQRASIIASFEETYAHMSLMAKTYESRSRAPGFDLGEPQKINPQQWQDIRQKAALKIQAEVTKKFGEALAKATSKDGVVDIEKLNEVLAKQRKPLAHYAKSALLTEVVNDLKSRGADRSAVLNYMQNLCQRLDKKHTFTEQAATGHDYFYTSNYLQQGMLITGTKDTAHNKPKFKGVGVEDQAAFRRVTYTYRDEKGALQPTTAVSSRIPSPALVFDKKMSAEDVKSDLVGKYRFLHQEMRAMRGGKPGPVVENLFTSFHSNAFEKTVDWANNRQRTSVLLMMQAMHDFNAKASDNNYLYVQNIGTNRHTRDLGYRTARGLGGLTGSVELDDITLSAEMAMLHTMQENSAYLSPAVRNSVIAINNEVLASYKSYLQQGDRPQYFAESATGIKLIGEIGQFKKALQTTLAKSGPAESSDLPTLAASALTKMVSTDQHWDIRYGQLSQSLSMYMEWASTGGCKSGNERNQDVMLRFALLKSIHERVEHAGNTNGLQEHEKAVYKQLNVYAKGQTADPDELRAAIAVSVSKCNMHGGAAAISREDQGGAAKIGSFSFVQDIKNPLLRWAARAALAVVAVATFPLLVIPAVRNFYKNQLFDTNNAADREMHLDATGASKTQAHKGQDDKTRDAVLEVLGNDTLFKDKASLTKVEKAGFKKNEALCEAAHHSLAVEHPAGREVEIDVPIQDSTAAMYQLMGGSLEAHVSELREDDEIIESPHAQGQPTAVREATPAASEAETDQMGGP